MTGRSSSLRFAPGLMGTVQTSVILNAIGTALTLLLTVWATTLFAHTTSTGLAILSFDGDQASFQLTLPINELPKEPGAILTSASNGDQASAQAVEAWARAHIQLKAGDTSCRLNRLQIQGSKLTDDRVTVLCRFACTRLTPGLTMQLSDEMSADFGDHYRSIVSIQQPDGTRQEHILAEKSRSVSFIFASSGGNNSGVKSADSSVANTKSFFSFVWLGIEHILSGLDHLLFLVALLLGSRGFKQLFVIVTAFTLAHTITLALASFSFIKISPGLIEPLIALSIVWVAFSTLQSKHFEKSTGQPSKWWRATRWWRATWLLAFALGLIHGLGFAGALLELELPKASLWGALLAFNLGVELGQALVIGLCAPILYFLWKSPKERLYRRYACFVLIITGTLWCIARIFT